MTKVHLGVLLALTLHLPLVLTGGYLLSYDAYLHLFFADHYRQDWWQLWEPRWYTGFSVASYPPLIHQALALLSHVTGPETAFGVMLLLVIASLPVAVYRFSRVFLSPAPATVAALLAGLLPSVSLVGHSFGQLPALAGVSLLLWVLAQLHSYLATGRGFLPLVLWLATLAALHHVTVALFLPLGAATVALSAVRSSPGELSLMARRGTVALGLSAAAMLLVLFPFLDWYRGYSMQVPIDHASRHDFLTSDVARGLFLWPLYGPLLLVPVYALLRWRASVPLLLLSAVLVLLGLGGTTPLPALLYGSGWVWLTYDRFSLLATLVMLPYLGLLWGEARARLPRPVARALAGAALLSLVGSSIYAALLPRSLPTQPAQLDLAPAAAFLDSPAHSDWRYITLGLGDQMNHLAYMTRAASVDGSYHTARRLPELTASGIGQLDGSLWWDPSGGALAPFLGEPDRFALRWVLVNDVRYTTHLARYGWQPYATLEKGIEVWAPPHVPPRRSDAPKESSPLAAAAWGVLPLLFLALAAASSLWAELRRRRRREPLVPSFTPDVARAPRLRIEGRRGP